MRRAFLRIALGLAALGLLSCVCFMWTADSHHLNLRYILWKHHAWSYQDFFLSYLNVDVEFRESLRGKTKAEVRHWFPVLIPKDKAVLPSQKYYGSITNEPDFYWIGDSNWAIWFEEERVKDLNVEKG